jgi:hypothetical protein
VSSVWTTKTMSVVVVVHGAYFTRVTCPELFGFIFEDKKRLEPRENGCFK